MIHFHLSEEEARLVGEGLGRLIAEGEANAGGDHMTAEGRQMLRAHTQRLRILSDRLQARLLAAPPKGEPKAAAKRGNPRRKKSAIVADTTPPVDADLEDGFRA